MGVLQTWEAASTWPPTTRNSVWNRSMWFMRFSAPASIRMPAGRRSVLIPPSQCSLYTNFHEHVPMNSGPVLSVLHVRLIRTATLFVSALHLLRLQRRPHPRPPEGQQAHDRPGAVPRRALLSCVQGPRLPSGYPDYGREPFATRSQVSFIEFLYFFCVKFISLLILTTNT